MSFSSRIKEKLAPFNGGCGSCGLYELAGFMGSSLKINKDCMIMVTENLFVAERITKIINGLYGCNIKPEYASGIYKIKICDENTAAKMLEDTGHLKDDIKTENECCMGAYARGAFLGGGSITDPQKSYHMEFDYKFEQQAKKLENLLHNSGISAKITERKGHFVVYVKEYESIAGILGLIGAGGAAIEIYNVSAEKELRNEINRQMNCENANMDKIASAYCRHLRAIEKIKTKMGLEKLPDSLREAAVIRMKYPEDSLKDLGKRFKEPIGKSGVNHRLNRIIEIADNL